jgi:hypothetical protein|tara:strand:+ start:163 stop:384 length:222 start_codon:yes stop_codon:yes gene_type:complete
MNIVIEKGIPRHTSIKWKWVELLKDVQVDDSFVINFTTKDSEYARLMGAAVHCNIGLQTRKISETERRVWRIK